MTAYLHLTVSHADFELLSGEGVLQEYRFSTGQARHLFCRHCGIKSFYQPRSHPQAWSVNLRCVALPEGLEIRMVEFDGQDWERHVENIVEAVN